MKKVIFILCALCALSSCRGIPNDVKKHLLTVMQMCIQGLIPLLIPTVIIIGVHSSIRMDWLLKGIILNVTILSCKS